MSTPPILSMPSVTETMRRRYIDAHALRIAEKSGTLDAGWLANELDKFLRDYCDWLEKVAKHYEEEAIKAYRLKPSPPFVVRKDGA